MIGAGFSNMNQFDPDAGAFINTTRIGGIQADAVNTLVNELKAGGVWSRMIAIYPFVGGSSVTCKYNLVNPQDTDAAGRLSFAGTWTFDANGATPNGSSGTYANTFINPSLTPFTSGSGHLSYYCPQNYSGGDVIDIGCGDYNLQGECTIATRWSDSNIYYIWYNSSTTQGFLSLSNSTTLGYYISNRLGTGQQGWKNGTKNGPSATNGKTTENRTLYLGAENNGTTSFRNSPRKHIFTTIGLGLTDTQATNLNNSVQKFVRTLNKTA